MADRVINAEELATHTKESDVWFAIHGKVYNITSYLADHPGGMDVMLEHGGKDATEEFEYYGHSDKARQQMASFLVGTYEEGDSAPVAQSKQVNVAAAAPRSSVLKWVQALGPIVAILLGIIYVSYF